MPFQPAVDCVEINIRGQQAAKVCEMTIGALFSGAYGLTDLQSLANLVDVWAGTDMIPLMGAQTNYTQTYVRGLTSSVDIDAESHVHAGVGTHSGGNLAAQVSVVGTKRSGHTGRSARGRMFTFGTPAGTLVDDAHISAAYQTAWNVAFHNLLTAIGAAAFTPVVISRYNGLVRRPSAVTFNILDVIVQDTRLDTQRRRLGKT